MRVAVTTARVRRTLLVVVPVFLLVVVIWTVVVALHAASELRAVRADVHRLTSGKAPDRTTLERHLEADLRRAQGAQASLSQVGPTVFGWIPVLGRNVDAERV